MNIAKRTAVVTELCYGKRARLTSTGGASFKLLGPAKDRGGGDDLVGGLEAGRARGGQNSGGASPTYIVEAGGV